MFYLGQVSLQVAHYILIRRILCPGDPASLNCGHSILYHLLLGFFLPKCQIPYVEIKNFNISKKPRKGRSNQAYYFAPAPEGFFALIPEVISLIIKLSTLPTTLRSTPSNSFAETPVSNANC